MIPRHQRFGPLLLLLLSVSTTALAQGEHLRLPPPALPEATEAWQDGRPAEALAVLDRVHGATEADSLNPDRLPLEALVLGAVLNGEIGFTDKAETFWRAVIDREVWMRTFARRALVDSMISRGAPADAAPILVELDRSDATRHLDLNVRIGDAYRDAGDRPNALRVYRQIISRQHRGQFADHARLEIAAALEQDDDIDGALTQLREAKLQHWQATAYETAKQMEGRLRAVHDQSVRPFSEEEYRLLVRRLRNASRFALALALIDEWRAAHAQDGSAADIEAEVIQTLYAQRSNEEAVAACRAFYEQFPDSPQVPDIRLTDFRLAVRMVDTSRARLTGVDLWEGRVRGTTLQQRRDAATLLSAYLVAVGEVAEGLGLYRQLFASSQSADEQRALLWRAGVAALRDGQHERAVTNLRGLINRRPSGDLAPAALYWLGVAEGHTDAAAARRTLSTVEHRYPYHYYGMRARQRLEFDAMRTVGEPPTALTFPALTLDRETTERPEYRAATVLSRAGLVDDAAWYLRRLLDQRRQDRALALAAARASATAGDYASVSRILATHFGAFLQRPAEGLPDDFWHLAFPRPFWDEVTQWGQTHDVDPLLLLSLMRQESRFDPDARSPVGAIGLFQIMTYTAEALAERAGVGHVVQGGAVDRSILAEPRVNAAIAAQLTRDLLSMFSGSAAPVVASYNAGEERVAVWWAAAGELSEDFFVDTIPYSETRRFVREVLTNRAAYERIYGDQ